MGGRRFESQQGLAKSKEPSKLLNNSSEAINIQKKNFKLTNDLLQTDSDVNATDQLGRQGLGLIGELDLLLRAFSLLFDAEDDLKATTTLGSISMKEQEEAFKHKTPSIYH